MNSPTVLITGVSSGIGHGLACEYLGRGATVWGVSRRKPDDIDSDQFSFAPLDLTDHPRVAGTLGHLLQGQTRLDVVVLNAGVLGEIADMRDTSLERLRGLMEINTWANKSVIDALHELSIEIGQVVALSSGAAVNGNRGWSGYAISKAALNMLMQLYARENPSVHFAAVAPGLVDTAMQDYLCGLPDDQRYQSLDQLKIRRNTAEMPSPAQLAPRLVDLIELLPGMIESGQFVDIRNVPVNA